MKRLKHKYYYDEVYRHNFVFLLNVKNDAHLEKILSLKKYGVTRAAWRKLKKSNADNITIDDCQGKTIYLGSHRTMIVVRKLAFHTDPYFYSILAHECLHAAMDILNTKGVTYTQDGNHESLPTT